MAALYQKTKGVVGGCGCVGWDSLEGGREGGGQKEGQKLRNLITISGWGQKKNNGEPDYYSFF